MRALASFIGLTLFTLAKSSFGQGSGHPTAVEAVHFTYAADEGCPSKADFTDLLAARGASFLDSESATRTLDVSLRHDVGDEPSWRGSMRVADDASTATRSIAAPSCAELARSLAIFTSLALNPPPTTTELWPPVAAPPKPSNPPPPVRPRSPPLRAVPTAPETTPFHRGRWGLDARGAFVIPLGSRIEQWGVGIAGRWFASERWALRTDVDLFFAPHNPEPTAPRTTQGTMGNAVAIWPSPLSEIGARSMMGGEYVLGRAHGTLAEGGLRLRRLPIDLTMLLGAGALWTRPISRVDPQFRSFGWSPRPAAEAGLGERLFVTERVAFTLDEMFFAYLDRSEEATTAPSEQVRAQDSTWFDALTFRAALGVHLGLELMLPAGDAPPPRRE